MGQTGMPDTIRSTVGGCTARPKARSRASLRRHGGFRAAVIALALPAYDVARADDAGTTHARSTIEAFFSAFTLLDRHEIAGLALTLGILCFAVVTAILLVRTRNRL